MRTVIIAAALVGTAAFFSAQPGHAQVASISDLIAGNVPLPEGRPADLPWLKSPPRQETAPAPLQLAPPPPSAIPAVSSPVVAATATPEVARSAPEPSTSGAGFSAFRSAVEAIGRGDIATADNLQARMTDSVARSAIEWLIVRSAPGYGGAQRGMAFLARHPGWPSRDTIREHIETILFDDPADPGRALGYFADNPPVSGKGEIAMARALIRSGRKQDGAALLRKAWATRAFDAGDEKRIMSEFSGTLTRVDHFARVQGMLYRDRITSAERIVKHLGSAEAKLVKGWAEVIRRRKGAGRALSAVPSKLRAAPGYKFALIRHTRRSGDEVKAAKLMLDVPRDPAAQVDTGAWWVERKVLVRDMLDAGQNDLAYRMAADHASTEPEDIADAEWHAGWVALSYLRRPDIAAQHFARIRQHVETPISLARASYWMGRAAKASGQGDAAHRHFSEAARHPTTYYGQLAGQEVGQARLDLGRIARSTKAVDALEPMRAARLFEAAGRKDLAMSLTVGTSFYVDTAEAYARLAVLARENGAPHVAVNIAKRGMRAGHNVADEAYPVGTMPGRGRNGAGVPPSLVYAIARQESEFNRGAVSGAGARGLMQLMPNTAKSIARESGLKYNRTRLTTDPDYNATLGAAYLGKRIRDFGGSYIMAAAAYNAGKSRVDQWVERFGDPRDPKVDAVEWVERIPFNETRNYVQRVMENMQVYEARLGGNSSRLALWQALNNGS